MKLLPSHLEDLKSLITKKQMRFSDFEINTFGPIVTYKTARGILFLFKVEDSIRRSAVEPDKLEFNVLLNPGSQHTEEHVHSNGWSDATQTEMWHDPAESVLDLFERWLDYIKRELNADRGSGDAQAPTWATTAELEDLKNRIESLESQATRLAQRLALLWQTGEPLNESARLIFADMGFAAQHTGIGATYDLLIPLSSGSRLLMEVTGIEGNLTKGKGGKIAQIVDADSEALKGDRVVVLVNAYRKTPPANRSGPLASADALRVIVSLGAILVSSQTLYKIWDSSRTDLAAARARIEALATADPGEFI